MLVVALASLLAASGCENQALVRKYDGPYVEKPYLYGDQYVTVSGLRICYTKKGQGPPLIFLRGVGGSADYWDETLPHFTDDFTVYALDLPGFGKSDKPDVDYSLAFHTRTVIGFMDALSIKRASFVGNSLGGQIAMNIAIHRPERVNRLALLASTGVWKYPNPMLALFLRLVLTDNFFCRRTVKYWCHQWDELVVYETPNSEQKLREWIERRNAADFRALCRAYSRSIKGLLYKPLRNDVHKINAPTLLLWGDDDRWHPVTDAVFLHKRIPDSRLIVFKGGRHMLTWDFKEDFNREVLQFLTSPGAVAERTRTIYQTNHSQYKTH